MNNLGAISGISFTDNGPVVWEAGSVTPKLLSAAGGGVGAINDSGQIAGSTFTASGFRAVRWNRDTSGTYTQELLDELVPNASDYAVRNMNNSGAVIGFTQYQDNGNNFLKQVLWQADGSVLDMTAIADHAGIRDFTIYDINDSGWILGTGSLERGVFQSFLFKPTVVPEPGFYLSLAVGLGGLWIARRRQA